MIIDEESRVGELLRGVDVPGSRADIGRAVASGRRRRRRRSVVAVAAATALVTAAGVGAVAAQRTMTGPAPQPAATVTCSASALPVRAGHYARAVFGVDPTGRFTVGMSRLGEKPPPGATPSIGWQYDFERWDGTAEPVSLWSMYTNDPDRGPLVVAADGTVLVQSDNSSGAMLVPLTGRTLMLMAQPAQETVSNARAVLPSWFTPDGHVGGWLRTVYPTEEWVAVTWPRTKAPDTSGGRSDPGIRPDSFVPVPGFEPRVVSPTGVTIGVRKDADRTVQRFPERFVVRDPDGRERDLASSGDLIPTRVSQVSGDWVVGVAAPTATPGIAASAPGGSPSPSGSPSGTDSSATATYAGPPWAMWNLKTGAAVALGAGPSEPGVGADGTVAYSDTDGRPMLRTPAGRTQPLPLPPGGQPVERFRTSDDGRTIVGSVRVADNPDAVQVVRWTCQTTG